jgi:hypothetical protein
VKVLNKTNGQSVSWTYNGQSHSVDQQSTVGVAGSAQRMYFNVNGVEDFIEFTITGNQIWVNTTRVAGFGLKLAIQLHSSSGQVQTVGETEAVFAQSREATFQSYRDSVPAEFQHLADGTNRINAPWQDAAFKPGGASANYFAGSGFSTVDVFACSGPLANDPNRCAEINRGPGGNYSPPANFYAKWTHDIAINGKSYGFAYDDVGDASSLISVANPQSLIVAVGL